ncbi:Putative histone h3 lys4 methyltransferase comple x and rna cleavage factor ii complex subunit swd2 [Trichuris trichiura]|uniref:Putative histone h3 lys4 methyltransferase comple x and rna cleavage factor ii complex subunit swd2 n=1 Tax=Trichuris trichiura TaxID=36087 RepID=A0A077Z1I5_TRITR|nr:Putative histone h3 lys4 methyltransferase comple x and rna cleavage factor ii complex subunit swd2 [Trichuris trichiura]
MILDQHMIRAFAISKVFEENTDVVNSIDFNPGGSLMITGSDDDSIVLYDCSNGTRKRQVNSKKYGVTLIRFTNAQDAVVHGSNKVDDGIRHLSLHDNKYIRYFNGHTKRVIALSVSPVDGTMLSGSLDRTVRLWDLRSQNCQGYISVSAPPMLSFDPEGIMFALAMEPGSIRLYDMRYFEKGPYNTFTLPQMDANISIAGLKFSPDGKVILLYTNGSKIYTVDSYQGHFFKTLTGHKNPANLSIEASFTPDGVFVLSGSADGNIYFWKTETGENVAVLAGENGTGAHSRPVRCVRFSPTHALIVSACKDTVMWVPVED